MTIIYTIDINRYYLPYLFLFYDFMIKDDYKLIKIRNTIPFHSKLICAYYILLRTLCIEP